MGLLDSLGGLLGGLGSLVTGVLGGLGSLLSNRRLKSDVVAVDWSR